MQLPVLSSIHKIIQSLFVVRIQTDIELYTPFHLIFISLSAPYFNYFTSSFVSPSLAGNLVKVWLDQIFLSYLWVVFAVLALPSGSEPHLNSNSSFSTCRAVIWLISRRNLFFTERTSPFIYFYFDHLNTS